MLFRQSGIFHTNYANARSLFPLPADRWMIGLLLAFALTAPFTMSTLVLSTQLLPWLVWTAAVLGLNLILGWTGQFHFGYAAIMGIGAYTAVHGVRNGIPWEIAMVLGGVMAAVIGIVFAFAALRVKGLYLAVATLAAQFFSDWMFLRVKWFVNDSPSGSVSVNNLQVFGMPIESATSKYLFCLAVLVVLALLAKNLVRSAIGREWMAIRDMDVAAAVIGIRPMYAKLTAFAVSSFIIGVAGGLWAFVYLGAWEPAAFGVDISFRLLFMVIIGGLGSIMGAFFGAGFIVVLPIVLNQLLPAIAEVFGMTMSTAAVSHVELMIFGGLIVWFLIVEPHGLARLWSIGKQKLRLWPFPH